MRAKKQPPLSKSKDKPNFTALTHQVVHDSPEPLPFDEILWRVNALAPIATKNPRNTIRGAVSQSHLIVATGDGRYGWKPRVINGSSLRVTLSDTHLVRQAIGFGDEVRDALWPSFFEIQLREDSAPVHLQLPAGVVTRAPLEHLGDVNWGTTGSPEFWQWLKSLNPAAGDHLIFRVLNGEAKLYSIEYQPRASRDENVIAGRNEAILQAALAYLRRSKSGAAIWDICEHLLSTGQYKHPIPPDPLSEIWTEEVWGPELEKKGYRGGWMLASASGTDSLVKELFGQTANLYDNDNPQDLPGEYQPGPGRRPRPSRKAQKGEARTFICRVKHKDFPKVWRDIEIADDQTLEDLHLIIQEAFEWDDDHLYSFFMSGKAWDGRTEIGAPWAETDQHTHQVEIGSLDLQPARKFLYLFDYGDGHEFDVEVMAVNSAAPSGAYPRIVGEKGKAPPQYPDFDE